MRFQTPLLIGLALVTAGSSWGEMPYPSNPLPCSGNGTPAGCIAPTEFARYLFVPTTTPLTLPNDFSDDWKLTSERTGEAAIDNSAQELFGVKGASVDRAWQITTGRPDVLIAVLDSGIRWQDNDGDIIDLLGKFYLNRGELPVPEGSTNQQDPWDRNQDGVFNVFDYAGDSRVSDQNGNGIIDPEDLIFLFSDGKDDDHNGYVDDIAGWDFFEDDNDPLDEVRYGHGTGEANDSNGEANNGVSGVGTCPSCMVMPVRVGDSFIAEVNNFAQGVLFATDSGARVIQEALGTLNNSGLAQNAIDYAYRRGVIVVASAADEESDHHNYPANYNHTMEVNSVTKFAQVNGAQQTPHSYLYLNGCTNYGGHIAVSVPSSSCSSEATGKSSGMAGLMYAAALNAIDTGRLTPYRNDDGSLAAFPLSANEAKQLLTLTADDINFDARPDAQPPLPQNYATTLPFPGVKMSERFHSVAGWDQYFGYGRINADTAVRRVAAGMIPPEAEISSPAWFQTIDPDMGTLAITGRAAANRASTYGYTVDVAPGIQPADGDFAPVVASSPSAFNEPTTGVLAAIPLPALVTRMPHGVVGPAVTADGLPDPDRFTFTVRLRVTDANGNHGEDRRVFALHHDPDLVSGTARQLASDGNASPVLADLDGDGVEDLVLATSDGVIHAFRGTGNTELPGWPVHTDPIEVHDAAPAFHNSEIPAHPYTAVFGAPAIGDLDRDGHIEVVAADIQGKLYVWNGDGTLRAGFPVSTNPAYSNSHRSERDLSTADGQVPDRKNRHTSENRVARGFAASPTLGNLDGSADGSLEIVIGALDRHVYAWHGDGSPVPGWPALIKDPAKVQSVDPVTNEVTLKPDANADIGTKIITSVSLGDIDGDGTLDVVLGANEEYTEKQTAVFRNPTIILYQGVGALPKGNGRTYALFHDGTMHGNAPIDHGWNPDAFLPGWPVKIALLTESLLPTVGTGVNGSPALADLDKDGRPEIAAFGFLGPGYILNGSGGSFLGDIGGGLVKTLAADTLGVQSNSIDAPAYPALGGGVLAEMNGPGAGFQFIAPTLGLGALVEGNLPAHQTPSQVQLSMWNVANADGSVGSGNFAAAFPRVVNDLQFLNAPAIADIDGDGLPEAIQGTGVYDLHAFNINGVEPVGWPKFTGGWTVTTATAGDIDGDGRAEVISISREGSLFIWRTTADECSFAPWPQHHHDLWNTSNYATDARPPAPVLPETATLSGGMGDTITMNLAAVPGDDLFCGAPASLDIRVSLTPISTEADFKAAASALDVSSALPRAGRHQSGTVSFSALAIAIETDPHSAHNVYVAVQSIDKAGNRAPFQMLGHASVVLAGSPTPPLTTSTPTRTATNAPTATATNTPAPSTSPTVAATATVTTQASTPTSTALPSATQSSTPNTAQSGSESNGGCAITYQRTDRLSFWLLSVPFALTWRSGRRLKPRQRKAPKRTRVGSPSALNR